MEDRTPPEGMVAVSDGKEGFFYVSINHETLRVMEKFGLLPPERIEEERRRLGAEWFPPRKVSTSSLIPSPKAEAPPPVAAQEPPATKSGFKLTNSLLQARFPSAAGPSKLHTCPECNKTSREVAFAALSCCRKPYYCYECFHGMDPFGGIFNCQGTENMLKCTLCEKVSSGDSVLRMDFGKS